MSLSASLTDGLLRVVAMLHPEYKNLVDVAIAHETEIEKLGPVLHAAAKEGPGAFAAAVAAAPDLAKAIHNFVASMPATASSHEEAAAAIAKRSENVTRVMVGAEPMTPDDEQRWMDRASPISEDSRSGSG